MAEPLPERCCGRCANWTRANPDDLSAPEGKCTLPEDPGVWPFYWPHTLQRDLCGTFTSEADQKQIDAIAEEERQHEIWANSQFGAGA